MSAASSNLFVYGTLREDRRHEMHRVLAGASAFVGDGVANATLYDLGDYPGMALSDATYDVVRGAVYALKAETAAEVLRVLDYYEGLGPKDPLPHEYKREIVDVQLNDGRVVRAWAYVLTRVDPRYSRIPASDYLEWKYRVRNVRE